MKDVETKKYYAVECKCGHTGSKKTYIPIKFAVVASSGKEAAEKGRWIPRCKHHHKECILGVEEISKEEYLLLLNQNSKDPYLHCTSIQEQSHYDLEDRFVKESRYQDDDDDFEEESRHKTIGKTFIRNAKKYMRFNRQLTMEVCY